MPTYFPLGNMTYVVDDACACKIRGEIDKREIDKL